MRRYEPGEVFSLGDVLLHEPGETAETVCLEREPHFERSESPSELETAVGKWQPARHHPAGCSGQVARRRRERCPVHLGVADENARALEWQVTPLVQIECE